MRVKVDKMIKDLSSVKVSILIRSLLRWLMIFAKV